MVPSTCRVAFEVGFAKKKREVTHSNDQLPFAEKVVALSVGQVIIHWIAQSIGFGSTYPIYNDLFAGQHYPSFEQVWSAFIISMVRIRFKSTRFISRQLLTV